MPGVVRASVCCAPTQARGDRDEPGDDDMSAYPRRNQAPGRLLRQSMRKPSQTLLQPELYMRDGRIIRTLADAIALLREHEARPGVDVRDEVLHSLERA